MSTEEQQLRQGGQAAERAAIAAAVARVLGWSELDAMNAGGRARREALAGFANGYEFGGWLDMGTAPDGSTVLRIKTYAGRSVDPRETGIAGASTLD